MNKPISRRGFLKTGGAALGASLLLKDFTPASAMAKGNSPGEANRVLRIAHITDVHFFPYKKIPDLYASALRQIQSLDPLPDVIFNTGDSVYDSLGMDKELTLLQWNTFNEITAAECSLPVYHCIGNHDVWGWEYQYEDPSIIDDPLFGKAMAIQMLGLPGRYYSFDLAGWHFIMLDSTHVPEVEEPFTCYIGKLDEEQFNWLAADIKANKKMPVCVLSHIPLLCACEYYDGENETPDFWKVPAAWMHIDSRRTRTLFLENPSVKLCLSGHAHQVEDLRYLNVKYLNNGAICGAWWDGSYLDFPPGYVVIDLYDDGSATSQFMTY
jgi:3',5'-cyclic AMP phosphodiesterase CpdA